MGPLQKETGNLVTRRLKKAELLNDSFASVFNSTYSFGFTRIFFCLLYKTDVGNE